MDTGNQSMMINGANPDMLWYNIADYLSSLSKSMVKEYNKKHRKNQHLTWTNLDNLNKNIRHQLDVIISGDRNVDDSIPRKKIIKQQNENRTMKKKQTIRLNESQLKRVIAESVKKMLNEDTDVDFNAERIQKIFSIFQHWINSFSGSNVKLTVFIRESALYLKDLKSEYQKISDENLKNEIYTELLKLFKHLSLDREDREGTFPIIVSIRRNIYKIYKDYLREHGIEV